jgi:guanylate kinase
MEIPEKLKRQVAAYRPNSRVVDSLYRANIVLLAAISGGGKDAVKHGLLAMGGYHHIVSFTTRPPRVNHGQLEKDGEDYHFIDAAVASDLLEKGAFIEADVYAGNVYGTAVADIDAAYKANKIAITTITIEGAAYYTTLAPSVRVVFLLPPSFEVWSKRLAARYGGKQSEHDRRLRMQEAIGEIEFAMASDRIYVVVNDDLDETVDRVNAIAHDTPSLHHDPKAQEISRQLLARLHAELAKG